MTPRAVLIRADGGSRGNPGPAAYGAVLIDAATGAVLAEEGRAIGVATNNVAEYSGLIAGLKLAAEHAPGADIEALLDSKLVVEQMSGNWKIKHPDLVPLATEAHRLAPFGTTYTWVPREQNKHADRLANEALDGLRSGVTVAGPSLDAESEVAPAQGWDPVTGASTTLVLIRHGATDLTAAKRFSGAGAGADRVLSEEGREQILRAARWLSPLREQAHALVTSPLRRAAQSAQILAEAWSLPLHLEPRLAEMDFGSWEGLTAAEVMERDAAAFARWRASDRARAGGGENFREVRARVLDGLAALLREHAGKTLVVVTHVTPIKVLVAQALGAPLEAVFRMEVSPASATVVRYDTDEGDVGDEPRASLRQFNAGSEPAGAHPGA